MPAWRPTTTLQTLQKRAEIFQQIRLFFSERAILEVETPLLSHATVTDPHIQAIPAFFKADGASSEQTLYLQTSPEYAMKRLLAAGSGSIFQLCKAFRQGDLGKIHHPEFTMLEWYHVDFDHHDLMNEVDALLQTILQTLPAERLSYAELFEKFLYLNPHTATLTELVECAKQQGIQFTTEAADKNLWLALLLTHCIEPHIGQEKPLFLYDFPVSQAALATIRYDQTPPVASRFEVYFKGVELANGFHELQNADEQRTRFMTDLHYRTQHGMPHPPVDENFLAALAAGLPNCSGVALGVDRLIMLALHLSSLEEVMSFKFNNS